MRPLLLLIFTIIFAIQTQAAAPDIPKTPPHGIEAPKYSKYKRMTEDELLRELRVYTGIPDNWKNNISLLTRLKKIIPFQKKRSVEEERVALSYLYARKTGDALQQYAIAAYHSKLPQISGTLVTVQGDKRMVLNSYTSSPNAELSALLFFFKTLEFGDTGLETKKYHEFSLAFKELARSVRIAYLRALDLGNMPMIIEFESAALGSQSPLTKLFFNTLIKDPEQILKAEVTPDGGRLLAIHPYHARRISENLDLFSTQFNLKVNTLKNTIFTDPEAKNRLIHLLNYGEGLSGVLYTDVRVKELNLQEHMALSNKACVEYFK